MLIYDVLFGTGCVIYLIGMYSCYYYVRNGKCFCKKNTNEIEYESNLLPNGYDLV